MMLVKNNLRIISCTEKEQYSSVFFIWLVLIGPIINRRNNRPSNK